MKFFFVNRYSFMLGYFYFLTFSSHFFSLTINIHLILVMTTFSLDISRPCICTFTQQLCIFSLSFLLDQILTAEDWNTIMYNGIRSHRNGDSPMLYAFYFVAVMILGNCILCFSLGLSVYAPNIIVFLASRMRGSKFHLGFLRIHFYSILHVRCCMAEFSFENAFCKQRGYFREKGRGFAVRGWTEFPKLTDVKEIHYRDGFENARIISMFSSYFNYYISFVLNNSFISLYAYLPRNMNASFYVIILHYSCYNYRLHLTAYIYRVRKHSYVNNIMQWYI